MQQGKTLCNDKPPLCTPLSLSLTTALLMSRRRDDFGDYAIEDVLTRFDDAVSRQNELLQLLYELVKVANFLYHLGDE